MTAGFRGIRRDEVPDASIISRISQQVGGSFGTAILAGILTGATASMASQGALVTGFNHAF